MTKFPHAFAYLFILFIYFCTFSSSTKKRKKKILLTNEDFLCTTLRLLRMINKTKELGNKKQKNQNFTFQLKIPIQLQPTSARCRFGSGRLTFTIPKTFPYILVTSFRINICSPILLPRDISQSSHIQSDCLCHCHNLHNQGLGRFLSLFLCYLVLSSSGFSNCLFFYWRDKG